MSLDVGPKPRSGFGLNELLDARLPTNPDSGKLQDRALALPSAAGAALRRIGVRR